MHNVKDATLGTCWRTIWGEYQCKVLQCSYAQYSDFIVIVLWSSKLFHIYIHTYVCFYTRWSNYTGGFDYDNGERNIETYMANKEYGAKENGDTNDLVKRVNQEVFDLESVLHKGNEHRGTNMLGQREKKDDTDVSWS